MNIKEFIQSGVFKGILIGIFIAIIMFIIFQAGVVVGERKASFAHKFGENFERNFKNPRAIGFMQKGIPGDVDMPSPHGAVGEIVSIALPLIVVAGPDNLEKTVVVTELTEIREFRDTIQVSELTVGDFIVVLGTPNEEGQVEAKLIRTVPPPPDKLPIDKLTQ